MTEKKQCECNCGYTCGRQCGLDINECMELHYKVDCKHDFNGLIVRFDGGGSVSCKYCGMLAIDHGMRHGI